MIGVAGSDWLGAQQARTEFLTSGSVADGAVGLDVLNSWRRSKASSVGPDRLLDQCARDVDADTPLTRAAAAVLQRLADDMGQHALGIVLTSTDGVVLDRIVTDRALLDTLDEVQLARGYSYAEQVTGTNGIGTSLEAGRATFIRGGEHYVGVLTSLACAGTPIRDPVTRRVIGVVNLTSWASESDPLQFALAKNVGVQIEDRLSALKSEGTAMLLEAYHRQTRRHPGRVLAIGGDLVLMNPLLRQSVEPADQAALLDIVTELLEITGASAAYPILPSGGALRISTLERTDAGGRAGGVFLVQTQSRHEQSAAPVVPLCIPGLAGRSCSWQHCVHEMERHCRDRSWVIVTGERGAGRARLAQAVARYVAPKRTLGVFRPAGYGSADDFVTEIQSRTDSDDFAVVLADIDDLPDYALESLATVLQARAGSGWIAATTGQGRSPAVDTFVTPFFAHTVVVPPLRHRPDDIVELVPMLLRELTSGADVQLAPEALRQLTKLPWPGNVAQLRRVLAEAVAAQRSGTIGLDKLPAECRALARRKLTPLEALERDAIVQSLLENDNDKAAAAKALGMSRATIYRKIKQFGIS